MAKKKRTKKSSQSQAWGVLFLGIGILLFIAIATFNVNDPVNLNVQNNIVKAQNWLGPLGASISYVLMQWTLGYPILVLPALLILFSIGLITGSPIPYLRKFSGFALVWAFLLSIILSLLFIQPLSRLLVYVDEIYSLSNFAISFPQHATTLS